MSENTKWNSKYRPKKYSEYLGNTHVVEILKKMVETDKVPQTLLFSGESGLGKTSIALLLTIAMNCENKIDGVSCGSCHSCEILNEKLILSGEAPKNSGVHYIDITKANTVDEAKELVAQIKQRRLGNQKTIYILDEMQRASKEAQSCFLKIAEDTPKNVYIFLCTTNPEHLLEPLLNRFHHMHITKPTTDDIKTKLATICSNEGVNYTSSGLQLLIRKSNKVMRECINKAELISLTGDITVANVTEELYLLSEEVYEKFLASCFRGSLADLVITVDSIKESNNYSYSKFIVGLGEYITTLLEVKSNIKIENYTVAEVKQMRKYILRFTDDQLIKVIKAISTYSPSYSSMEFKILSLAIEIMDILKVVENVQEMNQDVSGTRYNEVTNRLREANVQEPVADVTTDDVSVLFNANTVTLTPPSEELDEESIADLFNSVD